MEEKRQQTCPYCAEAIHPDAVLCPHCRSRLHGAEPRGWYRNRPDKQIAGVATALAESFALPVTLVRLGFIVLTFMSFIGPVLYVVLWIICPFDPSESAPISRWTDGEPGAPSIGERLLDWAEDAIAWLRGLLQSDTTTTPPSPPPSNGHENSAEGAP